MPRHCSRVSERIPAHLAARRSACNVVTVTHLTHSLSPGAYAGRDPRGHERTDSCVAHQGAKARRRRARRDLRSRHPRTARGAARVRRHHFRREPPTVITAQFACGSCTRRSARDLEIGELFEEVRRAGLAKAGTGVAVVAHGGALWQNVRQQSANSSVPAAINGTSVAALAASSRKATTSGDRWRRIGQRRPRTRARRARGIAAIDSWRSAVRVENSPSHAVSSPGGTVDGDTWTWTGVDRRSRHVITLLSPKTLSFKTEISQDGATWVTPSEGMATKTD